MAEFKRLLQNTISKSTVQTDRKTLFSKDFLEGISENYRKVNFENPECFDTQVYSKKIEEYHRQVKVKLLEQKRSIIPTDEVIKDLIEKLDSHIRMNYEDFKRMSEDVHPTTRRFFAASIFLKFHRDERGCILTEDFINFVERTIQVENIMLDVAGYAWLHQTSIEELELERYIYDYIPCIVSLQGLHESMWPFYAHTAVRRFMFFLDPYKTRRISIKKLAHSTVMSEFIETTRSTMESNRSWFSRSNLKRLYNLYCRLDDSKNGVLSQSDLLHFSGESTERVQLTPRIIARIFEENITYQPTEMDYRTFLDLILALQNKKSPFSIQYFFRLLDIDKTGFISPINITYFYEDIQQMLPLLPLKRFQDSPLYAPPLADFKEELFDMVSVTSTQGISLQDLIKSNHGHTVISMLTDVEGFYRYDQRETLMQQNHDHDEPDDVTDNSPGGNEDTALPFEEEEVLDDEEDLQMEVENGLEVSGLDSENSLYEADEDFF